VTRINGAVPGSAVLSLNLQTSAASDGLVERIQFLPTGFVAGGSAPAVRFDREALELALEAAQSITTRLVVDLQRELRQAAEASTPPVAFSVTPPALIVHQRIVQLPLETPVFLSYSSGMLLIEAPELKLHGAGETVSEAITEMSEHLEGLVDHYRNLGPDKLTLGGQRIKEKLLGLPGL
jgi:hypothetical protein